MYVSRTFTKVKKSIIHAEYPMSSKFHLSKWKTYFSQFIDKFLKTEEVEYLIHYVKLKMWPALFYVNSLLFLNIFECKLLGWILFPPIYTEIENWDFECCSRLDFPIFPMMKEVKNWSFLDFGVESMAFLSANKFMKKSTNCNIELLNMFFHKWSYQNSC